MSANSYRQCPQCIAAEKLRQEKAQKVADSYYGKKSKAEYHKMLDKCKPRELDESLAQYYEIGVCHDGTFTISYRCSCDNCTYTHSYKHSEPTKVNPERNINLDD